MIFNKKISKIAFLSVLLGNLSLFCSSQKNDIVYLIATPRSGLVEFLRMIGQSNAFKVMHIPGNWAYCHANNCTQNCPNWYKDYAATNYAQVKDLILQEAEKSKVFVGENTHTACDFLGQYKEFINDQQFKFIFLVKNPHWAIIEYYLKKKDMFDDNKMSAAQLAHSFRLKDACDFIQVLKKNGANPLIVQSEDLYLKTRETVQSICKYINIPFNENLYHWQNILHNFVSFPNWYTIENTKTALDWHTDAIKSTGFTIAQPYAVDRNNIPTFEEVINPDHRKMCIEAYKENINYYNFLLTFR